MLPAAANAAPARISTPVPISVSLSHSLIASQSPSTDDLDVGIAPARTALIGGERGSTPNLLPRSRA
jgi:hypothetical protein